MKTLILLLTALLILPGCGTRTCKSGTLLLDFTLPSEATATRIDLTATYDGTPLRAAITQSIINGDSVELTLPSAEAYHAGGALLLHAVATTSSGTLTFDSGVMTLAKSCDRITVELTSSTILADMAASDAQLVSADMNAVVDAANDDLTSNDDLITLTANDLQTIDQSIDQASAPFDFLAPADLEACIAPIGSAAGCSASEICNNGIDDDCDGFVDQDCPCTPGKTQPCFMGPPGKRGVGACSDGIQVCYGTPGIAVWTTCIGGIAPASETCDGADNDCNGCVDDGVTCHETDAALDCPMPGDPRIALLAPFSTKALTGESFYSGTAMSWSWTITGTNACDRLFASDAFTPKLPAGQESFKITNPTAKDTSVTFPLSGDYNVTLKVMDQNNVARTCNWVQHVAGPGVRVELCWDHQGAKVQGGADLDLHLHKQDSETSPTPWFVTGTSSNPNPADCFFDNCTATIYSFGGAGIANFGYANTTPDTGCKNTPDGASWNLLKYCANPRLDVDNLNSVGVAENINVDAPALGDTFRIGVHYFGQDGDVSTVAVDEHPIVNVFCNGQLKAVFGDAPDQFSQGFNWGSGINKTTGAGQGMFWRVGDVIWQGLDSNGKPTCNVVPISSTFSGHYYVNIDKANTDFNY